MPCARVDVQAWVKDGADLEIFFDDVEPCGVKPR